MNQVKKNIFWIVLGVILAGALGFYVVTVQGINAQADALESQLDTENQKLENRLKDPGKIRNKVYVQIAEDYSKELNDRRQAIREIWEARQFSVDREQDFYHYVEGEDGELKREDIAAPRDPDSFRGWMNSQYELRNAILEEAGIEFPRGDESTNEALSDRDYRFAIPVDEQQAVMEQIYIGRELFKVLSRVRGRIAMPDVGKQDERRIDALMSLKFKDTFAGSQRSDIKVDEGEVFKKWPDPYEEIPFTVEFACHASLVVPFLQELERAGAFVVVPRSIHIAQIDQERLHSAGARRGVGESAEQDIFGNRRDREAPVKVRFAGHLLKFDFSKDTPETYSYKAAKKNAR